MSRRYLLYRLAMGLNPLFSRAGCLRVGECAADWYGQRVPLDRRSIQANLAVMTGQTVVERSPMVREVFRNFARYLIEFFNAHRYPPLSVSIEGYERFRQAVQGRRGGIVVTAHLGNWELGAMLLHRLGCSVTIVALPHPDPRVDELFNAQRRRCGIEVISLTAPHATSDCLHALRNGRLLGIAGDQGFGGKGIEVSFFGRRTIMPRGPAILSLRSGAPIIPSLFIREAPWRFRLHLDTPLWPSSESGHVTAIQHLTQAYLAVIEQRLRQFPTQWLMFQPIAATPMSRSAAEEAPIGDVASPSLAPPRTHVPLRA